MDENKQHHNHNLNAIEDTLNKEVWAASSFLTLNSKEIHDRRLIIKDLRHLVERLFGPSESSVDLFGSFMTGTSLPDGDLDLVVGVQYCDSVSVLRKLSGALRNTELGRCIADYGTIELVPFARIPLLKFRSYVCKLFFPNIPFIKTLVSVVCAIFL
jgi:DNA polymerase sigma